MDITIKPGKLRGQLTAIPSKSQAHRLLICAAFADNETTLVCPQTNQDIEATVNCLRSLGASIIYTQDRYIIKPVQSLPSRAVLDCKESGSTLRFMLPVVGALGVETTFLMSGRLPERPLEPLWDEMQRMGCCLSRPTQNTIHCSGKLHSGEYRIAGNVSSQFISGLLFAMALLPGPSHLQVNGRIESKPYINMTLAALAAFGLNASDFSFCASHSLHSPGHLTVEGDWSNAAFFIVANALGSDIRIDGLLQDSPQGDRAVCSIVDSLKSGFTRIDAADIPDLVPILAIAAGSLHGAEFVNIRRLRLKESDRVATVVQMLQNLGATTNLRENLLRVNAACYHSCKIDACSDHRIAMAAAIAATVATGQITISGAQCVAKSFPSFWDEFRRLGGQYE